MPQQSRPLRRKILEGDNITDASCRREAQQSADATIDKLPGTASRDTDPGSPTRRRRLKEKDEYAICESKARRQRQLYCSAIINFPGYKKVS